MPRNPFDSGASGDERAAAARAAAIRSYSREVAIATGHVQKLHKLESDIAKNSANNWKAEKADMKGYEKQLKKETALLREQGLALRGLSEVRKKAYEEESSQQTSLLAKYENTKRYLREIQADMKDTSTLLGSFWKNIDKGSDQLLRVGDLDSIRTPMAKLRIDADDVSGSIASVGTATSDLARGVVHAIPAVWEYTRALDKMDLKLAGLALTYGDADGAVAKTAASFLEMSRMRIIDPGAIDSVVKVTDSLMLLSKVANVDTGPALSYVIEQSQRTGDSFEDSARDLEQFSAMADITSKALRDSNTETKAFSFAIREDFVKAMMEASRQFQSQVVDLHNVAAAYQYAAKAAIDLGASSKAAGVIATGVTGALFTERQDSFTLIAGQREQTKIKKLHQDAMRDAERAGLKGDEAVRRVEDSVARSIFQIREGAEVTREQRGSARSIIKSSEHGGGLGGMDVGNMMRTTQMGMEEQLGSMHEILAGAHGDRSVMKRLIEQNFGVDASTKEGLDIADILNDTSKSDKQQAEEILKISKDAAAKADSEKESVKGAISAVMAIKDPIQQLFNIKDYLKVAVMTLGNLFSAVSAFAAYFGQEIPGISDVAEVFDDVMGRDARESDARMETLARSIATEQSSGQDAVEAARRRMEKTAVGSVERRDAELDYHKAQRDLTKIIEKNTAQLADADRGAQRRLEERTGSTVQGTIDYHREHPGVDKPPTEEGDKEATTSAAATELPLRLQREFEEGMRAHREASSASSASSLLAGLTGAGSGLGGGLGALLSGGGLGPMDMLSMLAPQRSTPDLSSLSRLAAPLTAAATGAGGPHPPARPGSMRASGPGTVTVGSDGRARMQVSMDISNMEEVVAYANEKATFYNSLGIG